MSASKKSISNLEQKYRQQRLNRKVVAGKGEVLGDMIERGVECDAGTT